MPERNSEVKEMNEVEKKVKIGLWRQRIGYGSSDFACNLIWQMISLYLLYFYTNVMHLNAGAVSVMFLVTKVIDGISDLIVGFLIDKTNTKWGKSRPWILFGAVPFGVAAVLAFSVPDIGQTGMLIYAYITYILLSTAYTVVNIPMASILPALSEDPHERTVLASCRTFFSSIGSTVVSAFALTLVDKFGNGNEALGFRIVMMIFGVVGCLVFFFCFFNTKERVTIKQEKVSLKANISCLLHNKPWKLFALQPDPVDYGEWKSGVNTAGTLSAVNGFIGKVGMAIASSIGAALLQFGGFDANLATQTATAQTYITAMYIWVPIITNIATIITMMFYDLDKIYPQIVKELR